MSLLVATVLAAAGVVSWELPCAVPSAVTRLEGRFSGEVRVSGQAGPRGWDVLIELPEGRRTLSAETCALAAQGVSLVLRVLLVTTDATEPAPAPAVVTAPPLPFEPLEVARSIAVPAVPRRRPRTTASLGASAVLGDLVPPSLRVSTLIEVSADESLFAGVFRFASALPLTLQSAARTDGLVLGMGFETTASLCALPRFGRRVRGGACLGAGAEYALFISYDLSAPNRPDPALLWLLSLISELRVELDLAAGLTLYVGGGAAAVLPAPPEGVRVPTLFAGAPLVGRLEAGLGWKW